MQRRQRCWELFIKAILTVNAFTVSAEYGYRRELPHEYFIEPQAELTYGNMGSCDYVLSFGAKVHNDTYKSLIGRVGLTLGRQYAENNVYVKCRWLTNSRAI